MNFRGLFSITIALAFVTVQSAASFAQANKSKEIISIENNSSKIDLLDKLSSALKDSSSDITKLSEEQSSQLFATISRLQALFAKSSLNSSEQSEIKKKIADLSPVLEKLVSGYSSVSGSLVSGGVLPDSIAKQLSAKCGSALNDVIASLKETGSSITKQYLDSDAQLKECKALYILIQADLLVKQQTYAANLKQLEGEHKQLEEQMNSAKTPEERKVLGDKLAENEAKIKQETEKQKKTEKVRGEVNWGLAALGILTFAVGVVLAANGDEADGIGLMIAGGKAAEAATNPKDKEVSREVSVPGKKVRDVETKDPGDAPASEAISALEGEKYTNITDGSRKGNFVVMIDNADRSWVIFQLSPRKVVVRILPTSVQVPANPKLKNFLDLTKIKATELKDITDNIKVRFQGEVPGPQNISGGVTETALGSRSYSLTVD